jgi:uncharacterized LabA/DUF88 family protein
VLKRPAFGNTQTVSGYVREKFKWKNNLYNMKQLHIFIDGSWLFRVCQPEGALASKTENSERGFSLNFDKLNRALLEHVKKSDPECSTLGDRYFITSIFKIPDNIDTWTVDNPDISTSAIEKVKRGAFIRGRIAENAMRAGYKEDAIFRPRLKHFMIEKLASGKFQEKQVDASLVALLVRSAITKSNDYHLLITGDSDIIPAVKVAYPEYSKNVVIATTHPDELRAEHRQTSFSFNSVEFSLPPFYLQDHIKEIIHGDNVYECGECRVIFTRPNPFPANRRPYCSECNASRT